MHLLLGAALLFGVALAPHSVHSLPQSVPIGGLFNSSNEASLSSMFKYAVDRMNAYRELGDRSKLQSVVQEIGYDDSFHASKKVCQMLKEGVTAIFGPPFELSSSHVQSMASFMELPHFELRSSFKFHRPPFSINIHPHPVVFSRAFYQLVKALNWKSFAIIFEENEGLVHLQELLKGDFPKDTKMIVRQLNPGDDHRPLLKEIKKGTSRIILDCSIEKVYRILMQAHEVGMMNPYYDYVITSLDLHMIDLDQFRQSGPNITGFSILRHDRVKELFPLRSNSLGITNHSSPGIRSGTLKTEAALLYDAVHVFAQALRKLTRMLKVIPTLSCDKTEIPWHFGAGLMDTLKHETRLEGLTGLVVFNDSGFRDNFDLQLLGMSLNDLETLGTWNSIDGLNFYIELEGGHPRLLNRTVKVACKFNEPYVMEKPNPTGSLEGNDRYEGYSVDLMYKIAAERGLRFTIQIFEETGALKNGTWTPGIIKSLIDKEVDVAIGDLTITHEREQYVDFTDPFMTLGISILYLKDAKKPSNLFSFTKPLSSEVWIYMATAYLGISITLFLLARLSPYEWESPHPCDQDMEELENQFSLQNCIWFTIGSLMQQGCDFLPKFNPYDWENPHPCDPEPDELENQFSLLNSMWFTIGSLMQQGSDLAPKAISTRLLAGIWWFFTLIMVSSYTANLAAFLTSERMMSPINNVEDLAQQTKVKYGCIHSGSTRDFFAKSALPTYQTMWSMMEAEAQSALLENNRKGADRVLKGRYAFLMESSANEYFQKQNCELTQIGGALDSKGYGLATPQGSPYRSMLSNAILKLQERGELTRLKEQWWRSRTGVECPKEEPAALTSELGLGNVGGVFVVLMAGMGLACVVGILEFVWKTRKTVREERGEFCDELERELKFALKCSSKKPVNRKLDSKDAMSLPLTNYS